MPDPSRPRHRYAPEPRWRSLALRAAWIGAFTFALLLVALSVYLVLLYRGAPDARDLREAQAARPSTLLSADGQTLATFRRAQQQHVRLEEVSPYLLKALIATEDQRFYQHHGVDFKRTVSAIFHTATGDMQGGSTITQQLARNLFPEEIGRERSLQRKLKEMITAMRIERLYTKDQILESYLNTVPYLYNVVGIEMAARTYCDRSALNLDALQSATLVGMLKGSHYYNPIAHPERTRQRRNVVLAQMAKHAVLSPQELRTLSDQPLQVSLNRPSENLGSAPHFAAHARKWLLDWAEMHNQDLYADGLVIETTLDSRLQDAATRAVERQAQALQQVADVEWSQPGMGSASGSLESYGTRRAKVDPFAHFWKQRPDLLASVVRESPEFKKAVDAGTPEAEALQTLASDRAWLTRLKDRKTRLEAGFLAMDPATGEVKAWVGSRDFGIDQYDHVAQAERQPGSTFKPFVYGAALESGISPEHTYVDGPVAIKLSSGRTWRPTDMTGNSGLPMSLREGLMYSKNTITAQVMQEVGVTRTLTLARAAGVDQSKLDAVPSLALGTSPVTLMEMVNGYATIAHEGQHHQPVFIKRIRDSRGNVLAEFGGQTRRAMSAEAAVELVDMMRGVVSQGTGTMVKTRFGIVADIAGKTGTTQNNTDGWFILMHPNLVAGAWVGFNDSRVTMRSNYWGQGGHNAILLVGDFFRDALKGQLIDPKATFAASRRSGAVMANWSRDGQGEEGASIASLEIDPNAPTSDYEAPPQTAAELSQVLRGMGRDPVTGDTLPSAAPSTAPAPATVPARTVPADAHDEEEQPT